MDGWNTTFLLGRPIFRGKPLVSGRVIYFLQLSTFFHTIKFQHSEVVDCVSRWSIGKSSISLETAGLLATVKWGMFSYGNECMINMIMLYWQLAVPTAAPKIHV